MPIKLESACIIISRLNLGKNQNTYPYSHLHIIGYYVINGFYKKPYQADPLMIFASPTASGIVLLLLLGRHPHSHAVAHMEVLVRLG